MYQGGYAGKILRINLTEQTSTQEDLPLEVAKDFIGGAGFGIKYLFDEVKSGTDPLGPDNKLIFASGPLSGTGGYYGGYRRGGYSGGSFGGGGFSGGGGSFGGGGASGGW